ncbi:MAG: hypothetical protein IIX47_05230 [Spirochaetaceae bacterium]|nr:hypothetical protein [Spirochaetaceae bacterium]
MNQQQWKDFYQFREEFREICQKWTDEFSEILKPLQKISANQDKVPEYKIENSIVYNTALDEVTEQDEIKLIVIGDNPGKNEQLQINQKYLVGLSGKIADNFFKKNPELKTDFRKNVIILNKTPIHTAKTKELLFLANQNEKLKNLLTESQIWMAKKTVELHIALDCKMWLVGYAEVKEKGIFKEYRNTLFSEYQKSQDAKNAYQKFFVFQHFSMNRFLIDLNEFTKNLPESEKNISLESRLEKLGSLHKNQIFGE